MKTRTTTDRWWDIWAALFLIFALMSAATRLYTTQWTTDLERVQYLTLIGGILGLALGQSRFSERVVRIFATVYTLFFIPWQMGSMQGDSGLWTERLFVLSIRLRVTFDQFYNQKGVEDSILFILLMAILFWLLSITAGYYLTRHGNYWASLIPSGIGLLIINHYDPANPSWGRTVGVFLFFALLLIGRMTYLRHKAEWQQNGISQPPETGFDLGRAMVAVVVIIFMLAWTVPAIAASSDSAKQFWESITHPWQTLRDRMGDMVSPLRSTMGVVSDLYGDSMSLGPGTLLSDEIVFTVEARGERPPGARYYWRALSYDTYQDGNWDNQATNTADYRPSNVDLLHNDWAARYAMEFRFRSFVTNLHTLYTGSYPLFVDKPGKIMQGRVPDGVYDVLRIAANPPLTAGEAYLTRSWVAGPSVVQLRESNMDYPDWVRDHYLQLPDDLSDRIPNLAAEITRGLDNPYDQTLAITQWLRSNIDYSQTIPNPPDNQEPLEWFLFDFKQGFCNYYASAEVIMLRSVGIPARMGVGFAQGELDEGRDIYTVRHEDAHAWPEVYFEGYGWIEFEPTVIQSPREFALGEGLGEDLEQGPNPSLDEFGQVPETADEDAARDGAGGRLSPQAGIGLAAGLFMTAGLAAFVVWRRVQFKLELPALPVYIENRLVERGVSTPLWLKNWSHRVAASPLEKAYDSINQGLRLMGQRPEASETPHERAATLSRLVPPSAEPLDRLLTEYEKGQYSPYTADLDTARDAGRHVRRLSWRAVLRRLLRKG